MGKIRAAVIGSEEEQKQKEKRDRQREGKKMAKGHEQAAKGESTQHHGGSANVILASETRPESKKDAGQASMTRIPAASAKGSGEPKEKKVLKKQSKKRTRSSRYTESLKLADRSKFYKITEALDLLSKMTHAKFDETVELHITTIEKGITGAVTLPHGTGKKTIVAIISPAIDPTGADKLLKDIEAGKIEFDILVATPDAMPRLARVARILGPRGLMPNPKNGTVTPKPELVAKKYEGGQIAFKTEAKAPLIHVSVGKLSFGKEKLTQNVKILLGAVDSAKIKSLFLKSTMSPSLRLEK